MSEDDERVDHHLEPAAHTADRPPTAEEEAAAEGNTLDPEVSEHEKEMGKIGAEVKGLKAKSASDRDVGDGPARDEGPDVLPDHARSSGDVPSGSAREAPRRPYGPRA